MQDATKPTRKEKFKVGIAGGSMTEVEYEIPASEPPVLPLNAELSVSGKRTARRGARWSVSGRRAREAGSASRPAGGAGAGQAARARGSRVLDRPATAQP